MFFDTGLLHCRIQVPLATFKSVLIALDMTTTLQAKSKACFGYSYHFCNMTFMNTELVRENEVNKVGLKTVLGANHGNGEYWICRLASQ